MSAFEAILPDHDPPRPRDWSPSVARAFLRALYRLDAADREAGALAEPANEPRRETPNVDDRAVPESADRQAVAKLRLVDDTTTTSSGATS